MADRVTCNKCHGNGFVPVDGDVVAALAAIGRAARSLAELARVLPRAGGVVPTSLTRLWDDDPQLDRRPMRWFLYIEEAPGLAAWWVEDGDKVRNRAGSWQRNPAGNDTRVRRMMFRRDWPTMEEWPDHGAAR